MLESRQIPYVMTLRISLILVPAISLAIYERLGHINLQMNPRDISDVGLTAQGLLVDLASPKKGGSVVSGLLRIDPPACICARLTNCEVHFAQVHSPPPK